VQVREKKHVKRGTAAQRRRRRRAKAEGGADDDGSSSMITSTSYQESVLDQDLEGLEIEEADGGGFDGGAALVDFLGGLDDSADGPEEPAANSAANSAGNPAANSAGNPAGEQAEGGEVLPAGHAQVQSSPVQSTPSPSTSSPRAKGGGGTRACSSADGHARARAEPGAKGAASPSGEAPVDLV